jgi:N-acetylmuramoyl-L-alanine amidase
MLRKSSKKIITMKILLDNGHGNNTPGKRSPDGLFRECYFTREIAAEIACKLRKEGYDAELLVPELYDIKLLERVHRANVKCQTYGASNVLLVSIHCNAAGSGKEWMNGRGWEAWTSAGQTEGDKLAECLYESALETFAPGTKIRSDWGDGDYDKENQFTILSKTLCPAVLTENFFMDNKEDVDYLLSDEGKDAIVRCHVEGIKRYINNRTNV